MSATLGDILRRAEKVLDYTQWIDRSIRGGAAECPWCHSNNGYHRANCELVGVLDDIITFNKAIKTNAPDIYAPWPGRCYRHHLRFTPSEEFQNNCPACYWEHEAAEEAALREKITPKR